eukprot:3168-Heterococcus_DN1.PRE.1
MRVCKALLSSEQAQQCCSSCSKGHSSMQQCRAMQTAELQRAAETDAAVHAAKCDHALLACPCVAFSLRSAKILQARSAVVLIFVLLVATSVVSATARVGALARPATARSAAPSMSLEAGIATLLPSQAQMLEVGNNAMLLAANAANKEADFGGYVGPIAGLIAIGALILVLSPPLQD